MKKITSLVLAPVVALALGFSYASSAAADDGGYSTDPDQPSLVTEVPDGFAPFGEAVVSTDDCITTTTQEFSRVTPGSDAVTHEETVTVVDTPAYDEVVHHDGVPAVTHVVHHPAVTHDETVVDSPAIWANWAPNDTHGPQDYTPIWPTDERGTWILHDQGIPPGQAGPDGVYQQGAGNSPWFYRQAEVSHVVTVVDHEAYDETVVDTPAVEPYDETVHHEAVTHDETITVVDEPGSDDVTEYVYTVVVTGESCTDEPPVDEPPVDEPPVDEPPVNTPQPKTPQQPAPAVPVAVNAGL
jgi:hypothetical protein